MTKEDDKNFDEPQVYSIAKYRLNYSLFVMVIIIGMMIFDKEATPPVCFGLVGIFAIYLFFPFTYRLVISNEAISSVNAFGTRMLEWNEIADIKMKGEDLFLINRDGDLKVVIKQQIENYPEVIKFIQNRIPSLWKLVNVQTFHQGYFEQSFSSILGLGIFTIGFWELIQKGVTKDSLPLLGILFLFSLILAIPNLFHIRKLSLEEDILIVYYMVGKRQIHVDNVRSVFIEQEYGKNVVNYPVTIRVKEGRDIVVKKIKEGNTILVHAVETWIKKYKRMDNDKA